MKMNENELIDYLKKNMLRLFSCFHCSVDLYLVLHVACLSPMLLE